MPKEKSKYYTSPKFGTVYINNEALSTPIVRLNWPFVAKPREGMVDEKTGKKGPDKFEVTLALPKKNQDVKNLMKAIEKMTKPMIELANKWRKKKGLARIGDCDVFKDGDEQDLEKNPQYKGCWLLVARKSVRDTDATPPNLIGLKKNKDGKFERLEPNKFPAGVLVRAIVTPLVSGSGISYQAITIQLIEDDGVRYGGSAVSAESYNHMLEGGLDEGSDDSDSDDEIEDDDDADSDDDDSDGDESESDDDDDSDAEEEDDEDSDESEEDDEDSDDEEDEDSEGTDDDEDEETDDDEDEEEELPKAAKGKTAARRGRPAGSGSKTTKKQGRQLALDRL